MHTHQQYRSVALLFRALGNERRLFLLHVLLKQPRTGKELVSILRIHQPAISRHLSLLLRAGLIISQRNGKKVLFAIRPDEAAGLLISNIKNLFAKRF